MQAIWEVQISSFNLMVLKETKTTDQAYCHNRLGYNVVCFLEIMTADGCAKGGVGLLFRDRSQVWII